mmetsp:Transcript_6646/g.12978  ORF Transcript_6646/g.12978 Transcript_6646/m.12978 type:complete len:250 (+) Transcript_6646:538-1287(+)
MGRELLGRGVEVRGHQHAVVGGIEDPLGLNVVARHEAMTLLGTIHDLVGNGFVGFFERGALALPPYNTAEGTDDEEKRLAGDFAREIKLKTAEKSSTHGGFVGGVNGEGATDSATLNFLGENDIVIVVLFLVSRNRSVLVLLALLFLLFFIIIIIFFFPVGVLLAFIFIFIPFLFRSLRVLLLLLLVSLARIPSSSNAALGLARTEQRTTVRLGPYGSRTAAVQNRTARMRRGPPSPRAWYGWRQRLYG